MDLLADQRSWGGKSIFWIFFESQQEDSQTKWLVNATFVSFVYTFEGIKLKNIEFCYERFLVKRILGAWREKKRLQWKKFWERLCHDYPFSLTAPHAWMIGLIKNYLR